MACVIKREWLFSNRQKLRCHLDLFAYVIQFTCTYLISVLLVAEK